MNKTETRRQRLTDQIEKATGRDDRLNLIEKLWDLAEQSGKDDLLIDLHGLGAIDDEGIETAIENNGCADPRR